MKYEVQIFAKDKTKIIKFLENENENIAQEPRAWDDLVFAMGAVVDDKADFVKKENSIIGILDVKETTTFEEVIDVMCEDLNETLIAILAKDEKISLLDLTSLAA